MTIEEAVRVLAGSLVLASVALGHWVHPAFLIFTAFVGANLLQSGLTRICPATAVFRRMGFSDAVRH